MVGRIHDDVIGRDDLVVHEADPFAPRGHPVGQGTGKLACVAGVRQRPPRPARNLHRLGDASVGQRLLHVRWQNETYLIDRGRFQYVGDVPEESLGFRDWLAIRCNALSLTIRAVAASEATPTSSNRMRRKLSLNAATTTKTHRDPERSHAAGGSTSLQIGRPAMPVVILLLR